jgi:hypothetical protein
MRTLITVLLLLVVAGCKSIRTPEVGSPSTPIVLGQPDREQQLPMLDLHPYGHKVETSMPILEPEKLIKVHIKGYTSDHSTYIGPHMVVIRVSPGYFVEPDGRHVKVPVAPELIETPEEKGPEIQQKSEVIGQKERETQGAGTSSRRRARRCRSGSPRRRTNTGWSAGTAWCSTTPARNLPFST